MACTSPLMHMFFVIFTAADQALVNHVCSFIADCTVSAFHDRYSKLFHKIKRIHRCIAVHNIGQQILQLPQTDSARNTFPTGVRMTHLKKCTCHVHRTESRRTGFDSAFQIFVKPFDDKLGTIRSRNFKSTHSSFLL